VSVVDVLVEMKRLTPAHVEGWRLGRIPYLERVVRGNLGNLSLIGREIRSTAQAQGLTPSFMCTGSGEADHAAAAPAPLPQAPRAAHRAGASRRRGRERVHPQRPGWLMTRAPASSFRSLPPGTCCSGIRTSTFSRPMAARGKTAPGSLRSRARAPLAPQARLPRRGEGRHLPLADDSATRPELRGDGPARVAGSPERPHPRPGAAPNALLRRVLQPHQRLHRACGARRGGRGRAEAAQALLPEMGPADRQGLPGRPAGAALAAASA
jgi:hypothetical protein